MLLYQIVDVQKNKVFKNYLIKIDDNLTTLIIPDHYISS